MSVFFFKKKREDVDCIGPRVGMKVCSGFRIFEVYESDWSLAVANLFEPSVDGKPATHHSLICIF